MTDKVQAKAYLKDNNYPTEFNNEGKKALAKASKQGETEIIQAYIDLEFPLDYQHKKNDKTLLLFAIEANQIEIIDLLLKYKPNLEIPDKDGNTALNIAVGNNQVNIVQKLIEAGASPNTENNKGNSPLITLYDEYCTKTYEKTKIATLLLEAGADYTIHNFHVLHLVRKNYYREGFMQLRDWLTTKMLDKFKVEYGLAPTVTNFDAKFYKAFAQTQNTETLKEWIRKGNLEIVSGLLEAGLSPNPQKPNRETPLSTAIVTNRHAILKVLLTHNVDINQANSYKILPIFVAAEKGDKTTVSILLEHGARADIPNEKGLYPFHVAVHNCELEATQALFLAYPEAGLIHNPIVMAASKQGGKKILAWLIESACLYIDKVDEDKNTALLKAMKKENRLPTKYLIEQGANLNVVNTVSETPLYLACKANNLELVEQLLKAGADPLHSQKNTGITKVVRNRRKFRILLQQYSNTPLKTKKLTATPPLSATVSPLFFAVYTRNLKELNTLIKKGVYADEPNYRGDTALMMAAARGYMDVAEILLKAGASIFARNEWQDTPGAYATFVEKRIFLKRNDQKKASDNYKKLKEIVPPFQQKTLTDRIKKIKDILNQEDFKKLNNAIDKKSLSLNYFDAHNTPITWSIGPKGLDIVEFLLAKGADPNIPNGQGETPLQLAIWNNNQDMVELLLEYKADPNLCCSMQNHPPLHRAIQRREPSLVYPLLNAGADPTQKNSLDMDAYTFAQKLHELTILEILKAHQIQD
ncbi:MAG: hypothetical protein GY810_19140 [Aureispira sp.]|nr:hypothetical protein [Aureispira sp.]